MKCQLCERDYVESWIHESHDVPCYLFEGKNRQEKKSKADKFPRHHLCIFCHNEYEQKLRIHLIASAFNFGDKYFGEKND